MNQKNSHFSSFHTFTKKERDWIKAAGGREKELERERKRVGNKKKGRVGNKEKGRMGNKKKGGEWEIKKLSREKEREERERLKREKEIIKR